MKRIKLLLIAIALMAGCGIALPAYNIALLQPAMLRVLAPGGRKRYAKTRQLSAQRGAQ